MKQQLDRIMEELKDLNKAVFNKSFDNDQIYTTDTSNDAERFTSIDIRIYDLEKDIKNYRFVCDINSEKVKENIIEEQNWNDETRQRQIRLWDQSWEQTRKKV